MTKKFDKQAKFILNDPQTEIEDHCQKPTLILLTYQCSDGKFKYSTKESIYPRAWDRASKEQIKVIRDPAVANTLEQYSEWVDEYFEQYSKRERKERKRSVTKAELAVWMDTKSERKGKRNRIEKPNSEDTKDVKITFFQAVKELIENAENGKITFGKKGKPFTPGTIKNWKKTLNILEEFNPDLSFDITMETYRDFIAFCNKPNLKTNKKAFAVNYVSSLIKDWKAMMEKTKKYHKNTIYRDREFMRLSEDVKLPYLNDHEIELIANAKDLTPIQQIIRDSFMINLYTGLRISDMEQLNMKRHFRDDKIVITTQKTKTKVGIPIADCIYDILLKYGNQLPRQYHRNVVNRELKKIGEKAGLTDEVSVDRTVGGQTITLFYKKYELLSNHTARRSFATNLLKETDIITAKGILGMSFKMLDHYNKRSVEENADSAKSLPIFSKRNSTA